MNLKLTLTLLVILNSFSQAQDACDCNDHKASARYRSIAKHDLKFQDYAKAKSSITPNDIIRWQTKYKFMITEVTRRKEHFNHARVKQTPEDSLYELHGYMWYVKHEKSKETGDCDFHIEIGPKEKNRKRVVVELTHENCDDQQELINEIKEKGFKFNKEFTQGIPCTVTGLGFFDGFHSKSGHGRKGITTSSAWELHPVKEIILH